MTSSLSIFVIKYVLLILKLGSFALFFTKLLYLDRWNLFTVI